MEVIYYSVKLLNTDKYLHLNLELLLLIALSLTQVRSKTTPHLTLGSGNHYMPRSVVA